MMAILISNYQLFNNICNRKDVAMMVTLYVSRNGTCVPYLICLLQFSCMYRLMLLFEDCMQVTAVAVSLSLMGIARS